MITREEAKHDLHQKLQLGILKIGEYVDKLFDQQDQLQQHIKSLEAKLNTEQLECDGCKWYDELKPSSCDCLEPCKRFKHGWDKDRYEPKDTQ